MTPISLSPSSECYEKSYMHRDVITHLVVTPGTDFLITASVDGHVKFWKKREEGIEFVKTLPESPAAHQQLIGERQWHVHVHCIHGQDREGL